jgi:hypothetical protein
MAQKRPAFWTSLPGLVKGAMGRGGIVLRTISFLQVVALIDLL